jgi:hypothetical protein
LFRSENEVVENMPRVD